MYTYFMDNQCLLWARKQHKTGYGIWRILGKDYYAHRVVYELTYGEIPKHLTIDHLCFNKLCIEPSHLEAVTGSENSLRYMSKFYKDNPNFPCGHKRIKNNFYTYNVKRGQKNYRVNRCLTCEKSKLKSLPG